MSADDRELEAFLRQFQPRRPPQLPAARPRRRILAPAAAVAAVVLVTTAVWRMPERSSPAETVPRSPATATADLTRLVAEWDVGALETVLLERSATVLPDVEAPDGVLRVLARR